MAYVVALKRLPGWSDMSKSLIVARNSFSSMAAASVSRILLGVNSVGVANGFFAVSLLALQAAGDFDSLAAGLG